MTYFQFRTVTGCALLALVLAFTGCDSSSPLSSSEIQEPDSKVADFDMGSKAIPGQYIVVLNDDDGSLAKSEANVRSIATSLLGKSGTLHSTYATALTGFSASGLSEQEARALESKSIVDFVEQDQMIALGPPCHVTGTCDGGGGGGSGQTTPWGVTRVGGPTSGVSGTAWVIDSGIDLDHPDLNVDTDRSRTFITSGKGSKSANDNNGHGTHVAGTIAAIDNDADVVGVAAGATVVAVKVLDHRGSGSFSGVIDGIDYVAANASSGDVANMSLGGGTSDAVDSAVRNAADQGVYFAIAAGNDSDDANNYSPARVEYTNVWTVSAFDDTDTFASFSNYGNPPIEFGAPGVDILSLYEGGGTNTLDGTSMASPHIAGLLMVTNGSPNTDGTVSGDPDGDPDPIATN